MLWAPREPVKSLVTSQTLSLDPKNDFASHPNLTLSFLAFLVTVGDGDEWKKQEHKEDQWKRGATEHALTRPASDVPDPGLLTAMARESR